MRRDFSQQLQRLLKEAKALVNDLEELSDEAGQPLPVSYDGVLRELDATRIAALQRGLGRHEGMKLDPIAYPPRGMNREEAARYIGVGTSLFDEMVKDRRMPRPKKVNSRVIWDRAHLDFHFTDLPEEDENPVDRILREAGRIG